MFSIFSWMIDAQTKLEISKNLHTVFSDSIKDRIIMSLDDLFTGIDNGNMSINLIDNDNFDFNRNYFANLKEPGSKDTTEHYFKRRLINLYPVAPSSFMATIACIGNNEIGKIFTILAKQENDGIIFTGPIKYNTKYWKTKQIGTITYHYPDTINMEKAEIFNQKNNTMALKLHLPVMDLEMYMCADYQEVLQLQGCCYDSDFNGMINTGGIVDPKTLFSVMKNEDFSHGIFHKYAANIRGKVINIAAEEGIAYVWGNAYHADIHGRVPDQPELVSALRQYIKAHPEVNLSDLFNENPDALAEYGYPNPISVKAVISGIICGEVEKQKGMDGIFKLIKCGKGDENYFECISTLLQINRKNFDEKVYELLFRKNG